MQIYANLFKINEKCRLSSIQKSQQICTWGGDVYITHRVIYYALVLIALFLILDIVLNYSSVE